MLSIAPVQEAKIPAQVAAVELAGGKAVPEVPEAVGRRVGQAVVLPAGVPHGLEEVDARAGPHHDLAVDGALLEPRAAGRRPRRPRQEPAAVRGEVVDGPLRGLERADGLGRHLVQDLEEVLGEELGDGQEAAVAVRPEGPVEDQVVGEVRHRHREVRVGDVLPFLAQALALAPDRRILRPPAHVEARGADDDVELVLDPVGRLDSLWGDFLDRLWYDLYVVLAQGLQESVSRRRPAAPYRKVRRDNKVGYFRSCRQLVPHILLGSLSSELLLIGAVQDEAEARV